MRKILLVALMFVLMFSFGCFHKYADGTERYSVNHGKWTYDRPDAPDWLYNPGKYSDAENLAFVGRSSRYMDEKKARDQAYEDVSEKIASTIITDVKSVYNEVVEIVGSTSEPLDPMMAASNIMRNVKNALVSGRYVEAEYSERKQVYQGGQWIDKGFVYAVLVKYPKKDLDRIRSKFVDSYIAMLDNIINEEKNKEKKERLNSVKKTLEKMTKKTMKDMGME